MPTPAERLATLEAWKHETRERLEAVEDDVRGGGDVVYERSVRGRLHTLEGTVAGMVLRRNFGKTFGSAWVRAVVVLSSVGTVAAAWYAALAH